MKNCVKCDNFKIEIMNEIVCPFCNNEQFLEILKELEFIITDIRNAGEFLGIAEYNIKELKYFGNFETFSQSKFEGTMLELRELSYTNKLFNIHEEFVEYQTAIIKNHKQYIKSKVNEVLKINEINELGKKYQEELRKRDKIIDEKTNEISIKEDLELENYEDWDYVFQIIDIIKEEKNLSKDEILKIIRTRKVAEEESLLQSAYYVMCDYGIKIIEKWIRMYSKFENKCIKCNQDIKKGQDIYWNKYNSKVKHVDCDFYKTIKNEIKYLEGRILDSVQNRKSSDIQELVIEIFIIKLRMFFKNSSFELKFNEISKLRKVLLNEINSLVDGSMREILKNQDFEKYQEYFKNKFIDLFSKYFNEDFSNEFQKIVKNVYQEEIFNEIVKSSFNKLMKKEILHLSKEDRDLIFKFIFNSSGEELLITDQYSRDECIEYLMNNIPENPNVKKLKILASSKLFKEDKSYWNSEKKFSIWEQKVNQLKTFCDERDMELSVKIFFPKHDEKSTFHNRFFIGKEKSWMLPDGFDRFFLPDPGKAIILSIDEEETINDQHDLFQKKNSLDLFSDLEKIKHEIADMSRRSSKRAGIQRKL